MSRKSDGPKGRDAAAEIEARLSGLLGSLGDTLGQIVRAAEAAKDGEGGTRPFHADADVRVRTVADHIGQGGTARARPTPRTKPAPKPAPAEASAAVRAPDVTTGWDGDQWTLNAELPGAAVEDLRLRQDGNALILEAAGAQNYRAEVPLPAGCDLSAVTLSLNNGILDLRLPAGPDRGAE